MLADILFLAWLSVSAGAPNATMPAATHLTAEASPALSQEQLAAALVEELVKVCTAHPEVERAFVVVKDGLDGSPSYMFIPIFDRDVSDQALNDADRAYQALFPNKGRLELMLIPRHMWKKSLGGVPPIYVRPRK